MKIVLGNVLFKLDIIVTDFSLVDYFQLYTVVVSLVTLFSVFSYLKYCDSN